jgi:predicted glycosyltransferase
MRILVYFGHPAQYYFLKNAIKILRQDNCLITIVIKSKDVLESLLKEDSEEYYNILPEGRKSSRFHILTGLLKRDIRLFRFALHKKFDLFIGSDASLAHIGRLLRIPVLTVTEDDISVIRWLARLTYPFTNYILTPEICDVGRYSRKKIGYNGYMKLAYLAPQYFKPVPVPIAKPYFLIRIARLNAHHDFGIKGLNEQLIDEISEILSKHGKVFISSEKSMSAKYQPYLLNIRPTEIHNYLANAAMLICDSQSMSMEAAMLGIPSIRFSDFAGRISVLEELEHVYHLTYGIKTPEPQQLIEKIKELLSIPYLQDEFQRRRKKMLSEKIDVTSFIVWFIENYPLSVKKIKDTPEFQSTFR